MSKRLMRMSRSFLFSSQYRAGFFELYSQTLPHAPLYQISLLLRKQRYGLQSRVWRGAC
jgi:hypothetical protein